MQTGSWPEAVGRYHSATPARNTWYREKVLAFWNQGKAKAPSRAEAAGPEVVRRPAALAQESPRPAGAPQLNKDALRELKTRLDALAPR